MTQKHTEMEYKFAADHIAEANFRALMMEADPSGFDNFTHSDTFWKHGSSISNDTVLRHRVREGKRNELTIKRRKSDTSLVDRTEVNLNFKDGTGPDDVEVWLGAAGYDKLFTLRKDYVDVFDFFRIGYKIEVVLYHVGLLKGVAELVDEKKFLEVEIKPRGPVPHPNLMEPLGFWAAWLDKHLKLGDPLNVSLFEYYARHLGTNYRI